METFRVRRVYDDPDPADGGPRVLVDRLWPRGVSKERADIDEWLKDVAPSEELRSWLHQDVSRYEEFVSRYGKELDDARHKDAMGHLRELGRKEPVTLVTAVKDVDHSHIPTLLRRLSPDRRRR
ncbi:DUF488 domain-containing protein [Streptomyces sp. AK02-01A]|uniref:DUF488 domain-containing protein n=1 Tax=Streptomyces sp. AK02-01A TaxID=3028648 RepID=UPI0029AA4D94|nr:DUF488 family protein [Streptomyces sp. AK02-01A]MDX3855291.1 DUF488 family protein [Streptomyces sp. AK02-01A]